MRLTTLLLGSAFLATACSGNGSSSPAAPTTPTPTTATLSVKLEAICRARSILSADVYVDSNWLGVASAGDSGVSEVVYIGNHNLTAEAYFANGVLASKWGPTTEAVSAGGYTETLRCP